MILLRRLKTQFGKFQGITTDGFKTMVPLMVHGLAHHLELRNYSLSHSLGTFQGKTTEGFTNREALDGS